jgi:hypothetical protein
MDAKMTIESGPVPTAPLLAETAPPAPVPPREAPSRQLSPDEELGALARLQLWPPSQNAPRVTPAGWGVASASGEALPKGHGYRLTLTLEGGPDVLPAVAVADRREQEVLAQVAAEIDAAAESLAPVKGRLDRLRSGQQAVEAEARKVAEALERAEPEAVPKLSRRQAEQAVLLESCVSTIGHSQRQVDEVAGALERTAFDILHRAKVALLNEVQAQLPSRSKPLPLSGEAPLGEALAQLVTATVLLGRLAAGNWGFFAVKQALAKHLPKPPAPPPAPPPEWQPGVRAGVVRE